MSNRLEKTQLWIKQAVAIMQAKIRQEGFVCDSTETAAFERQLEHMMTRFYDVKYPSLKSRQFFPVDTDYDPSIDVIKYRQFDEFGKAEKVSDYSNNLPRVGVKGTEFRSDCYMYGSSYELSIFDIRKAALEGTPIQMKNMRACRRANDTALDEVACFGDATTSTLGMLNHPNVEIVAQDTGDWSTATAEEILQDIRKMWYKIDEDSKDEVQADTLLVASSVWKYLQKKHGTDTDKTILNFLMDNLEGVETIAKWYRLDNADAAGTGPRAVAFKKDPEYLWIAEPNQFEQFAPQEQNLSLVVNTVAKTGGAIIPYPFTMKYMDNI